MRASLALILLFAAACGPPPTSDRTGTDPQDAGVEEADAGTATPPFDAPDRTWTYVPIADAVCANGDATGIAVNVEPDSKELVLFLQGGGACWEEFACVHANNGQGTSTHLRSGAGEAVVLAEAKSPQFFFNRSEEGNPFRAAHYVYVPYCTGDLHAGNNAKAYGAVTVQHKGGHNLARIVERLAAELPSLERIRFVGVSAGGYGVTLNWWRLLEAFPDAQVDVLNDSGPPIPTSGGEYGTMRSAWKIELPPDCADCPTNLPAILPYYAEAVPEPHRYALLAYSQDEVIRAYFGYAFNAPAYETRLDSLVAAMGPRQRTFRLAGGAHVMLGRNPLPSTSTGVSLLGWIEDFASGAAGWDHEGP